jgi:hypothetical protein
MKADREIPVTSYHMMGDDVKCRASLTERINELEDRADNYTITEPSIVCPHVIYSTRRSGT